MTLLARLLFGLAREEYRIAQALAAFETASLRERLGEIAGAFVLGYRLALEERDDERVVERLTAAVDRELHGFAAEGIGMGLALLDVLSPWRRASRLQRFCTGAGKSQAYMAHVGAGFVPARLPISPQRFQARLDPLLGWFAFDGFGFHYAFFDWDQAVHRQRPPRRLAGYARRMADVGIGRRLWLSHEPSVEGILARVAAFPADRQGDLWSGIGEACAFAGGRPTEAIATVAGGAAAFLPHLAQGVSFCAEVRRLGDNPSAATELACRAICGTTAAEAAEVTLRARAGLPGNGSNGEVPPLAVWRERVQQHYRLRS